MTRFSPAYLRLLENGELEKRAKSALHILTCCTGCAWECRVNRCLGETGHCRTGRLARVSSYGAHLGEENPLRGWNGSGTIFFSRCNLNCQFCQNHDISQADAGREVDAEELATIMLILQRRGCHNINFVSPSHVVPQIIAALVPAAQAGLHLPLVYNTGGYDSPSALKLLDGIIDIYMPDMKYVDESTALRYSKIPRYPQVNQEAVREMHRQVGELRLDENGLAQRGLLVRHLVLPNDLAGTEKIAAFLANEISPDTYLNLMDQYRPAYHAGQYPEINRPINRQEYNQALKAVLKAGLKRLDGYRSIP